MKSKRGEEIVEAAIVLPLLILIIVSMIVVTVTLFKNAGERFRVHRELVNESLASADTFSVKKKTLDNKTHRFYVITQCKAIRLGELAE